MKTMGLIKFAQGAENTDQDGFVSQTESYSRESWLR